MVHLPGAVAHEAVDASRIVLANARHVLAGGDRARQREGLSRLGGDERLRDRRPRTRSEHQLVAFGNRSLRLALLQRTLPAGVLERLVDDRAQELGCTNTVFTNPTGLPDENQHITAHDMALIMETAMTNETFRTIAATTSYTIPATNVSGGERVLTNSFTMTNNASDGYYEPCIGGK